MKIDYDEFEFNCLEAPDDEALINFYTLIFEFWLKYENEQSVE